MAGPGILENSQGISYFGYTKKQLITITLFAFVNTFASTLFSLQAPFYPKEAEAKGATATEYGLVLGIFQLVCFITAPLYGYVLSYVNPRSVFNVGIIVTAIFGALFGLLEYVSDHVTFIALSFVFRIIQACGEAGFVIASFTIIAMEFPDNVATTFATLETFWGLGSIVGPGIGGALYQLGGFILPFMFMGGCFCVVIVLSYLLLPKVRRPHEDENLSFKPEKNGIKLMLCIPEVAISFFSVVITASSCGFLVATLEPHLRNNFNLTPISTGAVFMIFGGMYALSSPIWGKFCDKSERPYLYTLGGSLMIFIGFLFIGPAAFIPLPPILWVTCLGLVILGLGTGAIYVSTFIQALKGSIDGGFSDGVSTYGLISGWYMSSFALGSFVGPSVGGVLLDHYGFSSACYYVLGSQGIIILATLIFMCVPKTPTSQNSEHARLLRNQHLNNQSQIQNQEEESQNQSPEHNQNGGNKPGDYGAI